MKFFHLIGACFCLLGYTVLAELPSSNARSSKMTKHTISIQGNNFKLDGQNLHIISGSLHYFRLPAEYWRDRLQKLKAAGLNSVSTYVEWSFHEPEERQYRFSGDHDLARFLRLAAEVGLHVLLRPGPYICAERDLGGLPYWLLGKYPKIELRSKNRDFMEETRIWLDKLFGIVEPLLFGNGGPVILVQVENEYGSYGSDMDYKIQLRDIMSRHVGTNAILYTTDGFYDSFIKGGAIPDVLSTVDFGTTENSMADMFAPLRSNMPYGPLMNSEFYPGWITYWGGPFATTDTSDIIRTLRKMIESKINVNFYVFFGGTNFEYMGGAGMLQNFYRPDTTSYDYDAPLNEAGDPTPKYYAIRNLLMEYNSELANITEPQPSPKGAYGKVHLKSKFQLLSSKGINTLGKKYDDVTSSTLPTFETLRQRSGMVLYETTVKSGGLLQISKPRDSIYVYLDGKIQGIISRMYNKTKLELEPKKNARLSLLVENQGRINYGNSYKLHDFKGILSKIEIDGNIIKDKWTITGFPLENIKSFAHVTANDLMHQEMNDSPVVLDGTLELPPGEEPKDTFLDTTGWGKGYVWVNGHNLGRYWLLPGPQVTLYVPGVWLKPAPYKNHIQVIEFEKTHNKKTMEFIDYPILNRTQPITRID